MPYAELARGRNISYADYGDAAGRPVLYCHGVPGSRLDPALAAERLARAGVRVIAPDRPGFGGTARLPGRRLLDWPADAARLMDVLDVDRFGVLGYSSGSKYALACARTLPQRLTGVAVAGGVAPPEAPGLLENAPWEERVSVSARPLALAYWGTVGWIVGRSPAGFIRLLAQWLSDSDRRELAKEWVGRHVAATVREAFRLGPAGVVDDLALELSPWGFALEEIQAHVHVWHGDDDALVPLDQGRYVAAAVPHATLTVIPRAGHLHYDRSVRLFELVSSGPPRTA